MSLWDTIKSGAKSAWRGVKNFFTGDTYSDTVKDDTDQDTGKETLNQQIANGNINRNTTSINNTATTTSGFDTLRENLNQEQTPEVKQEHVSPVAQEDREEDTFLDRLSDWFSGAARDVVDIAQDAVSDTIDLIGSRKRQAEYNNLEEMYAVGYDPDNRNVYYLDLNEDRGLFDWDFGTHEGTKREFDELLDNAILKQNIPGLTQQQKDQAFMDFYNEAKHLFRIRSDDRYTDGLLGNTLYGRRDNMYSQEELDMLATSGKTKKGKYEPTPEEFQDFVSMYLRNSQTQRDLGIKYTPSNSETEIFDMGGTAQSSWLQGFEDEALKGIEEYFAPMETVNPDAASNAKLTNKSSVVDGLGGRVYNHFAPLFRAEAEIIGRDPETWSRQDRYMLGQADTARQMSKVIAQNINEVMRQTLLYGTNKKGDIVRTPDMFENGESLNDIMTRGLRELAGEDEHRYSEHQSYIDIAENFANNALYIYRQDKDGPLKRGWNELEYFFKPVGTTLGEAGQAAMALGMDIVGGVSMGMLYDGLTKSYMDQDATVFRLLETDDGNFRRTVKKYYLDAVEYTPEVVGNLIPDIALYALTGPGALATTARHIGDISRTYKVVKAAEGASMLRKLDTLLRTGLRGERTLQRLGMSANKYNEIINATKVAPRIKNYQTLKTAGQLLDRAVTQVGLGQFMDAQRSAYDTEPYSQASFLMSVIGSAAFDAMPEIVRLATGRGWFNLLTGKYGDNIWSLARYIDSSEEAANNIARVLRKGTGEIGVDDIKAFTRSYGAIEDAAKQVYNGLTPEQKEQIGKMTKGMMYSYVNQAFGANSTIGKRVRQILQNKNTNVADVIKYLGNIPGDVSVGPYVSTIRLKNGTRADIYTKGRLGEYDPLLDSVFPGGFDGRVKNGFSQSDIDAISELNKYKNIDKNKSTYFHAVTDDDGNTTYYLTKEGLNRFGLRAESISLESLGITLKEAENTREALKRIKGAESVNISDTAIDNLSETGAYEEITLKVKELLGC